MNIPIEFLIRAGQHHTVEALRAFAERRLGFALRRFVPRIQRVTLRLVDMNGPRRGIDSRCGITIHLVDGRQLFVEGTAAWPFAAITLAAHRANEAIRRELGRQPERGETAVIGTAAYDWGDTRPPA